MTGKIIDFEAKRIRDAAWKEAAQLKDAEIRQLQEQIEHMKRFLTPEQLQKLAQEEASRITG